MPRRGERTSDTSMTGIGTASSHDGSAPSENPFGSTPPYVAPGEVKLRVPTTGTEKDLLEFTIHNPSRNRLAFRVTGTKATKFVIDPMTGFVEPAGTQLIDCHPHKQIRDAGDFKEWDHFAVAMVVAAKEAQNFQQVWKAAADEDIVYEQVTIVCAQQRSDSCKAVVVVRPPMIKVHVPSWGHRNDATYIEIHNKDKVKRSFKMKGTRTEKFSVTPIFGLVDPDTVEEVKCQPLEFKGNEQLYDKERITILTVPNPRKDPRIWDRDYKNDPRTTRAEIRIIYVNKEQEKMNEDSAIERTNMQMPGEKKRDTRTSESMQTAEVNKTFAKMRVDVRDTNKDEGSKTIPPKTRPPPAPPERPKTEDKKDGGRESLHLAVDSGLASKTLNPDALSPPKPARTPEAAGRRGRGQESVAVTAADYVQHQDQPAPGPRVKRDAVSEVATAVDYITTPKRPKPINARKDKGASSVAVTAIDYDDKKRKKR